MLVKSTEFSKGFICALSIIYHSHGGSILIDEALKALGADLINPKGIDEYDREMLIKFQKEGCT